MEQLFYVGSYSKQGGYFPDIRGKGLVVFALNTETGEMAEKTAYPEVENATYITKYGDDILLVASDQYDDNGKVMSFLIKKNGLLNLLSCEITFGSATCHLLADKKSQQVFVVSYMNSKLAIHSITKGKLSLAHQVYEYRGSGPNKERQQDSHAHGVTISPNEKWLYVCDLGSDKIWLHDTQNLSGNLSDTVGIDLPPGCGPRHLIFHSTLPIGYLICELNAKLLTFTLDESTGMLNLIHQLATLPEDFSDVASAAAIRLHPSAKALYVSNRNHDSITVFTIGELTGLPVFNTRFKTDGDEPRDFNFDPAGKWLVVAHQYSHNLVSFELDEKTGLPKNKKASELYVGSPVCVLF